MPADGSSDTLAYGAVAVVALLPVAVNVWKLLGWGYLLREIWRHLLVDLAVVALLVLILVAEPLKLPAVYGGLFVALCVAYLNAHPPAGGKEWFGSVVALLIVGAFFPRLHTLAPPVIVGLLISYLVVLRVVLPAMSRAEARAILAKKQAPVVAAELLHNTFGYARFFIGQEKFRSLLRQDDGYGARLDALDALHRATLDALHAQGIDWLRWNELRHDYEATRRSAEQDTPFVTVTFKAGTVPGKLIERAESGVALDCQARIGGFAMRLERLADGTYRVVDPPESLSVERVAGLGERSIP